MKNRLLNFYLLHAISLVFLFSGCSNDEIDPVAGLSSEQQYLIVDMDGEKYNYIQGDDGLELTNNYSTSLLHPNVGHGAGFRHKNLTNWVFYFFYPQADFKANKNNERRLFEAKEYDFMRLDRKFDYVNMTGVTISRTTDTSDSTGVTLTTEYQENQTPQLFRVTKVYPSSTSEKFIFVEGTFDCWIGLFDDKKNIQGRFRISLQVSE